MSDTVTVYSWTMLNVTHEDFNSTVWELFIKNDIGNRTIIVKPEFLGEFYSMCLAKQCRKAENLLESPDY
jgi:hypothetical protein